MSRWQRDKSKMGSLESLAKSQLELAANFERENQALRLKMVAMERALAARDAQVQVLAEECRRGSETGSSRRDNDIVSLCSEYCKLVQRASGLLVQLSEAQVAGNAIQYNIIVEEIGKLTMSPEAQKITSSLVLHPGLPFHLLVMRMDMPLAPADPPDVSHWDRVVQEIKPTPQQVQELAATWQMQHEKSSKISSEMEALGSMLTQAINSHSSVQVMEAHQRLQAALLKEHTSYRGCAFVVRQVLTQVQVCKCMVHSFPYFPDLKEIVSRLVSQDSSGYSGSLSRESSGARTSPDTA